MGKNNSWKLFLTRNIDNERAAIAVRDKQKAQLMKSEKNPDTQLRLDIQKTITTMGDRGETAEDIVMALKENQEFCKYEKFFESWVANYFRKEQAKKEDRER